MIEPLRRKAEKPYEKLSVEAISGFALGCSANVASACYGDDSEPYIIDKENEEEALKAAYEEGWRTIESEKTVMQACPACLGIYEHMLEQNRVEDLTIFVEGDTFESIFTD